MSNLGKIGWFREFWKREVPLLLERRELAFSSLGDTVELSGIRCRELSLRAMTDLMVADNPLINGGAVDHADVAAFVWRLDLRYTHGGAPKKWLREFRQCPDFIAIEQSKSYVDAVFENLPFSPSGKGDKTLPIAAYASYSVDLLASEYGWSETAIMDMPIKRVHQYHRRIADRKIKDYTPPIPFEEERLKALKEISWQV
jgi:hypothetical protein